MRDFIKYAIAGFLIVVIVNFFYKQDTWTGFYYSNTVESNNPIVQEGFKNKSTCFDWIDTMIKGDDKEDYECGTNCIYETNFDSWKCKNTYDSK